MTSYTLFALISFSTLGLLAQSDNLTQDFAAERSQQVRNLAYEISLDLKGGEETYQGTVTHAFELMTANDLVLDFSGKAIERVSLQGTPLSDFRYDAEQARLTIPAAQLKTGMTRLEIAFIGAFSHTGQGFHRFVDPADGLEYLYTHLEPNDAHRVYPCFDQPDLRATFTWEVVAPADWTVVANGAVAAKTREGTRTRTRFARTKNFSTYISHLSAGPYAEFHDAGFRYPLGLYCRQSLAKYLDADHLFEVTRKSFDFYEQYFDTPYAYGKYDQIFCPEYNIGAMENVGAVTWNDDRAIFRQSPTADDVIRRDTTLYHEMAHMWFGDLVTMAWWNDLWLKESFATYMSYLAMEAIGVPDVWTQSSGSKDWALSSDQRVTTHPILATIPDVRAAASNFDGITYGKGFAVLRQLDNYLGGTVFRDGCRLYFKRHAFSAVTLVEFMAAMESAAGHSLADWTAQWLGREGVNTVQLDYQSKAGRISAAKIQQLPSRFNDVLRVHATDLGLFWFDAQGKQTRKQVVRITYDGASTALPQLVGQEPPQLIVPNVTDIDFVKVVFDEHSLAWLREHVHQLEDPALKNTVWRILYDMVRDGKFPPRDFFELALAQVPLEQQEGLLESLLRELHTCVTRYIPDPGVATQYRVRFVDLAIAELKRSQPGSDRQSPLFEVLRQDAVHPKHFAYVAELLAGDATLPGFDLTGGRKWQLVLTLARHSHMQAETWAKRLAETDKSIQSHNARLTLQAMDPDPARKEALWRQITEDSDLSLGDVSAIAAGLFPRHQPEFIHEYIKPFFQVLPRLYQEREYAWVSRFVRMLFPEDGNEETVSAAHAFLEANLTDRTLSRMVEGSLDDLERDLRIRQNWSRTN